MRKALLAGLIGVVALSGVAHAQDFWSGKTVQMVLPVGPGDGYDTWGRLVLRHLVRHLPGAPAGVPQNMPGAGGLTAANHLYTVAPRDGTTIGLVPRDLAFAPLMGAPGARFDATRFSWIGSPTAETSVCFATDKARVKTLDDLREHELVVGSVGTSAGSYVYPKALAAMFGYRFRIIPGYTASGDIYLGLERGELDGFCGSYNSIVKARPEWAAPGRVNFLLQGGAERNPELRDTPFILDRARDENERGMLLLLYAGQGMGWPFLAPPELPAERLGQLRAAFDATMRDGAFKAEVEKLKLDLAPRDGAWLADLVRATYATPPALVERVRAMLK